MIVIKEHLATGKTIEEAIASGIAELALDRDSVSVEVVETPKKGFLGLGGSPAQVRLTYEVDLPDTPKPAPRPEPRPEPKPEFKPQPKPEPKPEFKPQPRPEPKPEFKPQPRP
ncbi:MAG TPA: Jag N-terminal domain-containing protein, partial [Terriglobales bacterium]|nr:Jag N-terminal domain-containing protein [Terriglobales bacterium]